MARIEARHPGRPRARHRAPLRRPGHGHHLGCADPGRGRGHGPAGRARRDRPRRPDAGADRTRPERRPAAAVRAAQPHLRGRPSTTGHSAAASLRTPCSPTGRITPPPPSTGARRYPRPCYSQKASPGWSRRSSPTTTAGPRSLSAASSGARHHGQHRAVRAGHDAAGRPRALHRRGRPGRPEQSHRHLRELRRLEHDEVTAPVPLDTDTIAFGVFLGGPSHRPPRPGTDPRPGRATPANGRRRASRYQQLAAVAPAFPRGLRHMVYGSRTSSPSIFRMRVGVAAHDGGGRRDIAVGVEVLPFGRVRRARSRCHRRPGLRPAGRRPA